MSSPGGGSERTQRSGARTLVGWAFVLVYLAIAWYAISRLAQWAAEAIVA